MYIFIEIWNYLLLQQMSAVAPTGDGKNRVTKLQTRPNSQKGMICVGADQQVDMNMLHYEGETEQG